jgi:hypothetical protein
LSDKGFEWESDAEKLHQPLITDAKQPPTELDDAAPKFNSIEFNKRPEQMPSVWLSRPPARDSDRGTVQLVDGQRLTLGDGSFEILQLTQRVLILGRDGQQWDFEWPEVQSIKFPMHN